MPSGRQTGGRAFWLLETFDQNDIADEPVSRILRALPYFQQLTADQRHSFITDVKKVIYGRIRCTIFARFSELQRGTWKEPISVEVVAVFMRLIANKSGRR